MDKQVRERVAAKLDVLAKNIESMAAQADVISLEARAPYLALIHARRVRCIEMKNMIVAEPFEKTRFMRVLEGDKRDTDRLLALLAAEAVRRLERVTNVPR